PPFPSDNLYHWIMYTSGGWCTAPRDGSGPPGRRIVRPAARDHRRDDLELRVVPGVAVEHDEVGGEARQELAGAVAVASQRRGADGHPEDRVLDGRGRACLREWVDVRERATRAVCGQRAEAEERAAEPGTQAEASQRLPLLAAEQLPDTDRERAEGVELDPEREPVERVDGRDAAARGDLQR